MKRTTITNAAIGLIATIVLVLILRVWASDKAASLTGPSAIHTGRDGTVYVISNDVLFRHDSAGNLLDRVPMSRLGIRRVIADFWVYENGDLLLRRDVDQTLSPTGWAELFARTGAGEKDRLGTGESILQRCSLTTFQCRNFGGGGEVFDKITAFSLMVDEANGLTYLSDTVGHQLLLLDATGTVVARSQEPFQFPNQIVLDATDGLLFVADTNNHRIAAVSTARERYGEVVKQFRIVHPYNPLRPTWPMSLARASDGKWWVINADNNMSFGTVMVLSGKGAFEKVVPLPAGADPLRLAVVGDRVLITDPALMRVYAARDGALLEDFGSPEFKDELSVLYRERRRYELTATISIGVLFVLFAGALLLARQARLQQAEEPALPAEQPGRRASAVLRYDYHSILGAYRIKFAVITVLLAAAILFLVMISRGLTLFHRQFVPVALLAHFVISLFTYLQLKRSSVEISDQGIRYQGMSRTVSSPWSGVRKISVHPKDSKIVTDHGNFTIGALEPSDAPPQGWFELLGKRRAKYRRDLIEEIRKRAPQAQMTVSLIVKRQWERLDAGE